MNLYKRCRTYLMSKVLFKNIILIVGGTSFAQLLTILVSPILTRIYPPDQYGILTVCNSLLILLSISISLDYQNAIPIADNSEDACQLTIISIGFLTVNSIILGAILLVFGNQILIYFNYEQLAGYKLYIVIGVFFLGLYNIFIQICYREKEFKKITQTKCVQSILGNLLKVLLGIIKVGPSGLIIGTIVGQSAGVMKLRKIYKHISKEICFVPNKEKSINLIRRYKKFPLYSAPNNYVFTATSQIPVLLLAMYYGNTVVGNFGMAYMVVGLPFSLIGSAIGQVFYAEIASYGINDIKRMKIESIKILKKMIIIGLIPFLSILFFAPYIFVIAFGEVWRDAGKYTQILAISTYFNFLCYPIGRILEIISQQQVSLLFNSFRLLILIFSIFLSGINNISAEDALTIFSFINALTYILLILIIFKELTKKIREENY